MKYVDRELKSGEPKALECSCGKNYYTLGNDTLEIYLFVYGSGAGNVWYRMYKKQASAHFEHIKSFKPLNPGIVEVLKTKHHGVYDFVFDERRGSSYTLTFNGENFDTAHIGKVPWAEFKKSGLPSYGSDSLIDQGFLFVCSQSYAPFKNYYNLSTAHLLAGFWLRGDDYHFIGYFPAIPEMGRTFYNNAPTLETMAESDSIGLEKRIHYLKGDRYIGELVPLDVQQKKAIEAGQIKMHNQFDFEIFQLH